MKKLLLCFMFLPLVITSCSDDDDEDYVYDPAYPIAATWTFSKVEPKELESNKATLDQAIEEDIKKDSNSNYALTFKKNGQITWSAGKDASMQGRYTLNGNTLTYTVGGSSPIIAEVSISTNTLTMLTDITTYYQSEEILESLIGSEEAKDATVSKVTTLETLTRK